MDTAEWQNAKGQRLSLRQKVLIFTTNKGQEFIDL